MVLQGCESDMMMMNQNMDVTMVKNWHMIVGDWNCHRLASRLGFGHCLLVMIEVREHWHWLVL